MKNVTCVSLQLRPLLVAALFSSLYGYHASYQQSLADSPNPLSASTWELSDSLSIFESCRDSIGV